MALALCFYLCWYFYPRSPCGERPWHLHCVFIFAGISIHALLAESDLKSLMFLLSSTNFYPRSPCGERLSISDSALVRLKDFYPRSPCGERLPRRGREKFSARISIHALLAESDSVLVVAILPRLTFLSTLSLRRATSGYDKMQGNPKLFLSTLSLRRATFFQASIWDT